MMEDNKMGLAQRLRQMYDAGYLRVEATWKLVETYKGNWDYGEKSQIRRHNTAPVPCGVLERIAHKLGHNKAMNKCVRYGFVTSR